MTPHFRVSNVVFNQPQVFFLQTYNPPPIDHQLSVAVHHTDKHFVVVIIGNDDYCSDRCIMTIYRCSTTTGFERTHACIPLFCTNIPKIYVHSHSPIIKPEWMGRLCTLNVVFPAMTGTEWLISWNTLLLCLQLKQISYYQAPKSCSLGTIAS